MESHDKKLKNGSSLGPYKIIRLLGEGGMGEVYEARDEVLGRFVALKVISPNLSSTEEFVKRFMREGQALARVNHKNVVGVYTLGDENGVHYIAMEYVDGQSLHDLLKKHGAFELSDALFHFMQLLEGVKALHENGIIHRDIKPKNIIVSKENSVKIIDFGIAKLEDRNERETTASGTIVGSIYYMAPEIIAGLPVSVQSDIWSLGVSLYEILDGRKAFRAKNRAALCVKIKENTLSFSSKSQNIPEVLKKIILKMCQKQPEHRYLSVAEIIRDILDFKATEATLRNFAFEPLGLTATFELTRKSIRSGSDKHSSLHSLGRTQEKSKRFQLVSASLVLALVGGVWLSLKNSSKVSEVTTPVPSATEIKAQLPKSPANGQRIWIKNQDPIQFDWSAESTENTFFEVSRDRDFRILVLEVASPHSPYRTDKLKDEGIYFWRLSQGISGERRSVFAPISFTIVPQTAPLLIYPFHQSVIPDSKTIKFYWQEDKVINQYRFQLATESSFQNLFSDQLLSESKTTPIQPPPGEYFWRVRAEDSPTETSLWSKVQSLSVQKSPDEEIQNKAMPKQAEKKQLKIAMAPPPSRSVAKKSTKTTTQNILEPKKLTSPKLLQTAQRVVLHYQAGAKIRNPASAPEALLDPPIFSWRESVGASAYELQISKKSDFSQLEWTSLVPALQTKWKSAQLGKYFWRVRAVSGVNLVGPYSSIGSLELTLSAPKMKKMFSYKLNLENSSEASRSIPVYWEPVPAASAYRVLVSTNQNFKTNKLDFKVERSMASLPIETGGRYYVKVAALACSGTCESDFSKVSALQIEKSRGLPTPIIQLPPNGASFVSFNGSQNPISFRWENVAMASSYRLEISINEGFNPPLYGTVTSENKVVINKTLPKGRVYWRLRAERGSSKSEWSQPFYFELDN